jgi:hypothetical protein
MAESDLVLAFGASLNMWTTRHGELVEALQAAANELKRADPEGFVVRLGWTESREEFIAKISTRLLEPARSLLIELDRDDDEVLARWHSDLGDALELRPEELRKRDHAVGPVAVESAVVRCRAPSTMARWTDSWAAGSSAAWEFFRNTAVACSIRKAPVTASEASQT